MWKLDYETLVSNGEVDILNVGGRTSILTINSIRSHHQGTYTCLALNAVGEAEVSTEIKVNGIN